MPHVTFLANYRSTCHPKTPTIPGDSIAGQLYKESRDAKAQSIAWRIRWLLLIFALLCLIGGIWFLIGAPPLEGMGPAGTPAMTVFIFLPILLIMQWLFLRPKRNWQIKITSQGRPLRSAVVAAAFIYMLLSIAIIATLFELPDWWLKKIGIIGCWVVMGVLWLIWTVVFLIYSKQTDHYTWMGKIIRGLISGSILELFVATAVFAWNPHKEECYCGRGSYTGLVFGGTVMLWAFGPGVLLLFRREKRRQQKLQNHAEQDI